MEIQICNLIDAYISLMCNHCNEGLYTLNMAWLADNLESKAKIVRKISNELLEKRAKNNDNN